MGYPLRRIARKIVPRRTRYLQQISFAAGRGSWATCRYLGAWTGLLEFHAHRRRYQVCIEVMRRSMPALSEAQARRLMRRTVQNAEMSLFENLRLQTASDQEVRDYAIVHGLDEFLALQRQGDGVILAAAHLGNYEILGARLVQEVPVTVTSLPLPDRLVQTMLSQLRQSRGIEVLHPEGQARQLIQRLDAGGVVALFADFRGPNPKETLPFFGQDYAVVTAPFRLALLTGKPVVPFYGIRRTPWLSDGGLDVHLRLPIPHNTAPGLSARERRLAMARPFIADMEKLLHQHPDQWMPLLWRIMCQF